MIYPKRGIYDCRGIDLELIIDIHKYKLAMINRNVSVCSVWTSTATDLTQVKYIHLNACCWWKHFGKMKIYMWYSYNPKFNET